MAYVGNPVDTQNTFQSLVGKRFSGDGSTTAFTLDVAPGNVLDIEVFVGNVRQDPNSAYTLSGTTLTFTGAPPSGTNNIYVVHQAKSVGTIDVPAGGVAAGSLATSVLTGQTDIGGAIADADLFLIDDGAGGTLRKTAASRIKTYASGLDGVTTGSGNVTITDGDLVVASGHGISFAATGDGSGSMTSELLDDYEEGSWTPACPNITVSGSEGKYTKVGRLVTVQGFVTLPSTSNSNDIEISGLPFTINNSESGRGGAYITYTTAGASFLVNGDGLFFLGQKNDTKFFASAADGNTSQDYNEVSAKQFYINGQFYTDS